MRAISLWQLWAEAMRLKLKRNETRSWDTSYRGWIAIHAAKKKFDRWDYEPKWVSLAIADGIHFNSMAYGAFLCFAHLSDCPRVETVRDSLSERELRYGDYSDGRFAWITDDLLVLPEPIPYTGHQGIFNWPEGDVTFETLLERAAIKEFCGNVPREQAEKEAREEMKQSR